MKSAITGALALMLSLSWTFCAVAHASPSMTQRPSAHSPVWAGSLAGNTLAHGSVTLKESSKIVISWERRELSRSHRVRAENVNSRSLRSAVGIDTNGDHGNSGHAVAHAEPEEDCGCKDDRLDPGGPGVLRSVKPQAGTF